MNLSSFENYGFSRGRPLWVEVIWLLVQALFVNSWLPGSLHRVWLLRLFGAHLGVGVVVKPHFRVKFPWRLTVGDYVWLGESVWIDNLAPVTIGSHVCISQGAYVCTGSHDWRKSSFDLIVRPVSIGDHVWICAKASLAPGTVVGEGAVLCFCTAASGSLAPWQVYSGFSASSLRSRSRLR